MTRAHPDTVHSPGLPVIYALFALEFFFFSQRLNFAEPGRAKSPPNAAFFAALVPLRVSSPARLPADAVRSCLWQR